MPACVLPVCAYASVCSRECLVCVCGRTCLCRVRGVRVHWHIEPCTHEPRTHEPCTLHPRTLHPPFLPCFPPSPPSHPVCLSAAAGLRLARIYTGKIDLAPLFMSVFRRRCLCICASACVHTSNCRCGACECLGGCAKRDVAWLLRERLRAVRDVAWLLRGHMARSLAQARVQPRTPAARAYPHLASTHCVKMCECARAHTPPLRRRERSLHASC